MKGPSPIICVTNRTLCTVPFLEQVQKAAKAGFCRIILREKDLSPAAYGQLAEQFLHICSQYGAKGTLHTYGDIAAGLHAQSLHLSMSELRRWGKEHPQKLFENLGASVHSVEEALEAEALGADYVTAGHVFDTNCKKGTPGRGTEFLCAVVKAVNIPVYAIGGITPENISRVRQCQAAGVCIMSSAMTADDPGALADTLCKIWEAGI